MDKKKNIILIGLAIVIVLLIVIIVATREKPVDTTKGIAILEAMEKTDVSEVNKKIQEIENKERQALYDAGKLTINEVFEDCLVIGDSVTQGLYEYGVLSQTYVVADRGTEVTKVANKKIETHIAKAKEMRPRALFLAYGMNDLTAQRGKPKGFVESYKVLLEELKEALPDTAIYVNSILPATQKAVAKNSEYSKVSEFNQELKKLCETEEVTFIDNTLLVNSDDYAQDGVHVTTNYYKKWVEHMMEVAEL